MLLQNTTLKELYLDMNDMQELAIMGMAGSLRTNTTIKTLRLGGNPGAHEPEGVVYLAGALMACPWHRYLDLRDIFLNQVTHIIPGNPPECKDWNNERYLDYCFHIHYDKMVAFACAVHPRLGGGSAVAALGDAADCLALISFYFWEPHKPPPGFHLRLARASAAARLGASSGAP